MKVHYNQHSSVNMRSFLLLLASVELLLLPFPPAQLGTGGEKNKQKSQQHARQLGLLVKVLVKNFKAFSVTNVHLGVYFKSI